MNSRLRLLAIERLFIIEKELTIKTIKKKLFDNYNIKVERKAIYKDIRALQQFYHINKKKVNDTVVYILERKNNE